MSAPYVFADQAMDTDIDTIAFPLAGSANGYVVFYARPDELILSVPQHHAGIVLTMETLEVVVDQGLISKSLETHLRSQAQ